MDRRLAVVIPSLNEAAALPTLLGDLASQRGIELECIVADGGSRDGSRLLAAARGARVVRAPRGRGSQMNHGADAATTDWLLFLHADSRLGHSGQLAQALVAIQQAARDDLAIAGHWPLRFLRQQPGRDCFYRYLEGKTASQRPHSIHGDQGLLIHREYFRALGGFDTGLPIFEDERLAADIFATGRWLLLPGQLGTSARRFESEGAARRYALMALMVAAEAGGLEAYLREVPGLYREQTETRRLRLRPYLVALANHLRALPAAQHQQACERMGRLLRDNVWQLAYGLDLVIGASSDGPCLRTYDRRLAPRLDQPWAAYLATGLIKTLEKLVAPR